MSTANRSFTAANFDRGMNSLAPDSELADKSNRGVEAYYLRDIVNADLLAGQIKRRAGATKALAAQDCHSLWTGNGQTFFVASGVLHRLSGPASAPIATPLAVQFAPARRVSYAAGPESIFASDGMTLVEIALSGSTVSVASPNRTLKDIDDIAAYGGGDVVKGEVMDVTEDPVDPLPAGAILAYLNGRLYSALGGFLFYSEPFMPRFYNPARNYIPFPADITMVEPCQNGVYISADQTYWLAGDPSTAELLPVLPYRAVRGTSGQIPNDNACYWFSERGVVIGTQSGEIQNLQEKTVAVQTATEGAAMFRETDGTKQIVAAIVGAKETVLAARSFMDAEVIRKETQL